MNETYDPDEAGTDVAPALEGGRPRVDPRFRRRWAEARRQEGRRRLHLLLALVVACLVLGAGAGLVHTALFRVRHVVVTGNAHTPQAEVLAAAGLSPPSRVVLMVGTGSRRQVRSVDALPWVASATFSRHWPWTLTIHVVERRASALVPLLRAAPPARSRPKQATRFELVDRTGRVLAQVPAGERAPALPVVYGLRSAAPGGDVLPARGISQMQMRELLAAAAAAPVGLARHGLYLAFRPGLALTATTRAPGPLVVLGSSSQIAQKWAVLAELGKQVTLAGYSQVDLTVPVRPALTPAAS